MQYKPYEAILKMAPQGLSFDERDTWLDMIPLIGRSCEPLPHGDFEIRGGPGWCSDSSEVHGGEICETLYPNTLPGPCDPEKLVRTVTEMIKPTLPFVDKRPIQRLYVGSFAPTYIFNGQNNHSNEHRQQQLEELFWSRMDVSYFRRLVYKPWGTSLFVHECRLPQIR
ncbi:MAG TPA: hypothetical protein PLF31_00965 [Candidatus Paceibacterota bacterium]|nr:hypothetical protein [Candidatus Paceibacterota bacterium]